MSPHISSAAPAPQGTDNGLEHPPSRSNARPSLTTSETDVPKATSLSPPPSWPPQPNPQSPIDEDRPISPDSNAGIDPLSRQIYIRTNSIAEPSTSIAQRLRNPGLHETPNIESGQGQTPELTNTIDATKEWRKNSSFLSRLSMRKPWTKDEDGPDSDSELGEARDEGVNARALTSVIGAGGGYIPFHKEPPRYIRVSRRNKRARDFNRLFLAQELSVKKQDVKNECRSHAPATAIGSKLLKGCSAIWAAEFSLDGKYMAVAGQDAVVWIFSVISTPEERKKHEEDEARDGSNGEKLSAPVFRKKPVREYQGHTHQVLALSWSKNGFLLSCSMDKTVKLWHPSRADCLAEFKHNDLVTSIAFHPTDDRFFLAGSLDAQLRLWSIPDKSVAFSTTTSAFQTAVGFSPDGKTAICGLLSGMCMFFETDGLKSQFQIHVRSSRGKNAKGSKITGIDTWTVGDGPEKGDIKVLITSNDSRLRIYSLKTRMLETKFRGHVCQSSQIHARFTNDAKYIISGSEDRKAYIWGPVSMDAEVRDRQSYEYFDAHPEVVTVALMAPTKSKQLLSASGDPIYDLCNPPPVTLVSLEESQAVLPETEESSRPRAWIERSKHISGNIIITTDRTGTIKVFRQDCAFVKRQQNMWETGSRFSGKLGVGRSASIRTKASAGHSRRGSLSLGPKEPASERIISWRQDIDRGSLRISRGATPTRSERSHSPKKGGRTPLNASTTNLARVSMPASLPGSPASSMRTSVRLSKGREESSPSIPPMPSFSFLSAEAKEGGPRESFWNLSRWRGQGAAGHHSRKVSAVDEGRVPSDEAEGDVDGVVEGLRDSGVGCVSTEGSEKMS